MAINVDISKITGINQVGNSYQRKSAVPLDYYSLFNTKAEAEAYATSNPVSYVGQVISYIDNGEVKVCVIANAAGLLREVGTKPVGDGKTIEVSTEGAVALLGAATAANGTLPMLEEVEGKSKLVWKTLEQIGAGDGNDNTTYAFAFADQKITIIPSLNGVAQTAIEVDLSVFATEDEMATAIQEAIDNLPEDKDTTYALSLSGMELTLTPSEGEAQKVTIDAYSKSEIDDKFAALPEDKDTTYSVKEGDKVLKLTGTEFATELDLVYENNRISLTGIDGKEIAGFDASVFVEDGVLQDVAYNVETRELTFTWNIVTGTDAEGNIVYKTDVVNIADLVDTYTAGNGLNLADNEFSVKIDSASEDFLTVGANGLKLSGVQDAIDAAKEAAIDDADGKLANKADASAVYTKEEANALLANKANSADVYTKDAADTLLADKADKTNVYTKEDADALLADKADKATTLAGYGIADAYTAAQTDAAITNKIKEMTGGESAADVLLALNDYKALNDREVWGDEFVNNSTVDGKYNPTYPASSRIDTAVAKLAGIAEGAQVNVIESVAGVEGNRIAVSTAGKAVSIDDSGLRADIADAKAAGVNAGNVASQAVQAAGENAGKIQTNTTDIANLKTLTGEHTTKISALELANTTHDADYKALKGTVDGHTTAIAGKAEQSSLDAVSAKAGANEQAIKTLNETTIPGINGAINLKANAADVYDKTTIDAKLKTITDAAYDDTEVRELIGNNTAAIENIYKVDGETKSGVLVTEITRVEGLVSAEADRAGKAEKALGERIDGIDALLNTVDSEDNITSLKELATWVSEHGEDAAEMAEGIQTNAAAIAAIYTPATGEGETYVAASGVLVTEVARLDKAIADNSIADKKYTDDAIAALKVKDVDNTTLQLNESGVASVKAVSTDLLTQGENELVLCAGNASGYITE